MNAGAPAEPRANPWAMTAATPGPGVATAKKYTTQKVASPYHDIARTLSKTGIVYSMLSPCSEMSRPFALLLLGDPQADGLVEHR